MKMDVVDRDERLVVMVEDMKTVLCDGMRMCQVRTTVVVFF